MDATDRLKSFFSPYLRPIVKHQSTFSRTQQWPKCDEKAVGSQFKIRFSPASAWVNLRPVGLLDYPCSIHTCVNICKLKNRTCTLQEHNIDTDLQTPFGNVYPAACPGSPSLTRLTPDSTEAFSCNLSPPK